jgi:DNA-binding beta-propeller fold protein YncE
MLKVTSFVLFLSCLATGAQGAATALKAEPLPLPGGPSPILMDYLAYDATTGRLWVPAGNTGRVDVVETATGKVQAVEGFPTAQRGTRTVGPSSASVGAGVVYIGNRADSSICVVEAKSLRQQGCAKLEAAPDGIAYVASTKELWVTAPREKAIIILDVTTSTPSVKAQLPVGGQPEGYAVDDRRGIFYTNLEDKDVTLAIDVRGRKVKSQSQPKCGQAGPRGIALDENREQLFVACTDRVSVLSTKTGALLAQAETGAGVDNPDYLPSRHLLYIASGKTAALTVFAVAANGSLEKVAVAETAPGCRVVAVDGRGSAFLPDSAGGRLLVVKPPP